MGDKLQFTAEAGPGDFIYVPPYVPHQEINGSEDEELECVLMRSDVRLLQLIYQTLCLLRIRRVSSGLTLRIRPAGCEMDIVKAISSI